MSQSAPSFLEMKYLTVIRHAKSSWDQPGLADHDRALNERGRKAAAAVATFLDKTYLGGGDGAPLLPKPDRLVSSTALRALSTAQIMREAVGLSTEQLLLDSRLYLAEAGTIMNVVRDLDESWKHVVLYGHNPGMHEFAERILARAHVAKMPTCSTVIMAIPTEFWGLAEWGMAQLIGHITPRSLERRFPELYAGISRADGED